MEVELKRRTLKGYTYILSIGQYVGQLYYFVSKRGERLNKFCELGHTF